MSLADDEFDPAWDVMRECELPAPKVHRIDGLPYHADTCYHTVWRANKKAEAT